jgi:hypothetical protein
MLAGTYAFMTSRSFSRYSSRAAFDEAWTSGLRPETRGVSGRSRGSVSKWRVTGQKTRPSRFSFSAFVLWHRREVRERRDFERAPLEEPLEMERAIERPAGFPVSIPLDIPEFERLSERLLRVRREERRTAHLVDEPVLHRIRERVDELLERFAVVGARHDARRTSVETSLWPLSDSERGNMDQLSLRAGRGFGVAPTMIDFTR